MGKSMQLIIKGLKMSICPHFSNKTCNNENSTTNSHSYTISDRRDNVQLIVIMQVNSFT